MLYFFLLAGKFTVHPVNKNIEVNVFVSKELRYALLSLIYGRSALSSTNQPISKLAHKSIKHSINFYNTSTLWISDNIVRVIYTYLTYMIMKSQKQKKTKNKDKIIYMWPSIMAKIRTRVYYAYFKLFLSFPFLVISLICFRREQFNRNFIEFTSQGFLCLP